MDYKMTENCPNTLFNNLVIHLPQSWIWSCLTFYVIEGLFQLAEAVEKGVLFFILLKNEKIILSFDGMLWFM